MKHLRLDPAVLVGEEWRHLGFFRRMVIRWASPNIAEAGAYLARAGVHYVDVPVVRQPGPVTRAVDKMYAK